MGGPGWALETLKSSGKGLLGLVPRKPGVQGVGVGVHGARDHPSLPPPSAVHLPLPSGSPWGCLPCLLEKVPCLFQAGGGSL